MLQSRFPNFLQRPIYLIFLIYGILLFTGLGHFPLIDWDENIYGAVSKSMYQNGEYFRLSVNNQLYTEKPPFIFWITSLSYHLLGISEFSTRLQSVLSALTSFCFLYWFGRRHFSEKLATFWSLLYSSSLVPLFLSRTAYIDHWFNTFLLFSFCFIYEYHLKKSEAFKSRILWILLASLSMGLSVLTKGPLGLFFPLASYFLLLLFERNFLLNWLDLIIGFLFFTLVIGVYYAPNLYLYGTATIRGFYEFQGMLLSKSLESHSGPWFYHFLIAPIGFFPWSALIFIGFTKSNLKFLFSKKSEHHSFSVLIGCWMTLLLLIFSIVQTKLPHYTSSLYLCLSFFGARLLSANDEKQIVLSKRLFYGISTLILFVFGLLFLVLPFLFEYLSSDLSFQRQYGKYNSESLGFLAALPGLILLFGMLSSVYWFNKNHINRYILHIWLSSQLFLVSISLFLAPFLIPLLQDKNLRLYDFAKEQGGIVAFYKYLSFYPMFYRDEPILIMGNYKFRDDSDSLSPELYSKFQKPLYLITTRNKILELPFLFNGRTFDIVKEDTDLILIRVK